MNNMNSRKLFLLKKQKEKLFLLKENFIKKIKRIFKSHIQKILLKENFQKRLLILLVGSVKSQGIILINIISKERPITFK